MQTGRKVSNIKSADLVAMARSHNVLRNLNFDQSQFKTTTLANGVHVSLSSPSAEELDFHFQLESNVTASSLTSYICRGGFFIQDIADTQTVTGLYCDGDVEWDEDWDDSYKSFELPADDVSYVYIDYDREAETPTLDLKSSLTWPAMEEDSDIIILGRIDTSSGVIEQYFRDDAYDVFFRPDTYSSILDQQTLDCNWRSNDLQMHEVNNCYQYSYSMCFYDADAYDIDGNATGELKWAIVDTHWWNETQKSIEIVSVEDSEGDWSRLQLKDFDDAGSSEMEGADLLMFRYADGPELKYADADAVLEWINTSGNFCTMVMECFDGDICQYIEDYCDLAGTHYDLTDIVPGNYTLHDHGNYWQNVDSSDGRYGGATWTFAVNNGSSIGNSDKELVISQDSECLYHGANTRIRVDWGLMKLWDGTVLGAVLSAEWNLRRLYDLDGDLSEDWAWRRLYQSPGVQTCDWELMHLVNAGSATTDVTVDWSDRALRDNDVDVLIWSTDSVEISRVTNVTDGTRTLSACDGTYSAHGSHLYNSNVGYSVLTTQVVGAQEDAEADLEDTSGTDNDGPCRAKLNALLVKLRSHGLIAT